MNLTNAQDIFYEGKRVLSINYKDNKVWKAPDYFYVENVFEGENTLTLDSSYGMTNVEYSTDIKTWASVTFDTSTKKATISIPQGGKVYLKGTNQTLSNLDNFENSIISCSNDYNIGGDLTTLLVPKGNVLDLTGRDCIFFCLFAGVTCLINASKLILPSTTLTESCYDSMFTGCISLAQAPELPATTLAPYCYAWMFSNCINLFTAPELPATTLAEGCYDDMFNGCIDLLTAPELPATTLAEDCYSNMFQDCTGLTKAPKLPVMTLTPYCYQQMFYGCTNLLTAPELPATTLVTMCYSAMFMGCKYLNKVTALFTNNSAKYCLENWLSGVSPTGTFIYNNTLSAPLPNSNIPSGWRTQKEGALEPDPLPEPTPAQEQTPTQDTPSTT